MPKEIINSKYYTGEDSKEALEVTFVQVGWTKNQKHIELGTQNPDAGEPFSAARGWFVQLDREGANRLIRSLRKARDDAYGKDA